MSGHITLGYANIKDECDTEIYISIKATRGKIKLVFVKPTLEVEVLKKVIADVEIIMIQIYHFIVIGEI